MGYFYFISEIPFSCPSMNTGKKCDTNNAHFSIWDQVSHSEAQSGPLTRNPPGSASPLPHQMSGLEVYVTTIGQEYIFRNVFLYGRIQCVLCLSSCARVCVWLSQDNLRGWRSAFTLLETVSVCRLSSVSTRMTGFQLPRDSPFSTSHFPRALLGLHTWDTTFSFYWLPGTALRSSDSTPSHVSWPRHVLMSFCQDLLPQPFFLHML